MGKVHKEFSSYVRLFIYILFDTVMLILYNKLLGTSVLLGIITFYTPPLKSAEIMLYPLF